MLGCLDIEASKVCRPSVRLPPDADFILDQENVLSRFWGIWCSYGKTRGSGGRLIRCHAKYDEGLHKNYTKAKELTDFVRVS